MFHETLLDILTLEENEEELLIIHHIKEYSKVKMNDFTFDFVVSVQEQLNERGFITQKQYNALVKIYKEFKMYRVF